MVVQSISESAFGESLPGVSVRLSVEEARVVITALQQAIAHPPQARDGINTDYAARDMAANLIRSIRGAI